ncbi:HEXXH motif domain-containing protein [Streptomyces sp. NBC_00385]|uniref:HEXXH motif domain-containing protein n=1 Tax=Streptomyces sp. NBC_00385 TaxID=2975733 RepID=UPI002DDB6FCB|nr:HEXXH motif domain-containing protein [Streptomyces sp. NBC_00385]WRZ03848.1 HEXXH motif domain-containing protein [Streptomyces sp. NBC_00385]
MSTTVPDPVLRELGRTEGGPATLGLLARAQDTRRLVLLRAVLDAAAAAPATVCPPPLLDRLREDWALLEAAERTDRAAVRTVLLHPMAGPWAQRLLAGLMAGPDGGPHPVLRDDLSYLTALAAAAAIRAGTPCRVTLRPRDGLAALPTLGAVRAPDGPVGLSHADGEISLRPAGAAPLTVRAQPYGTPTSADPRWLTVLLLPALPGSRPVPLDDIDPYGTEGDGLARYGLSAVAPVPDQERKAWAESWSGVERLLRIGGEHRLNEAAVLLRSVIPLGSPPGAEDEDASHCSGTRREAFGAVLSSKPATSLFFASTLVHELQHTKLAGLADLVPLHQEDATPRHFAPWRPDPRPFDGLLHGAYSHLALADYWQRYALHARRVSHRDLAWAEHARCREQVGAVLPVLAASAGLTREGRVLVNEMITVYHRLDDSPPPPGHLARAQAYVSTARVIWQQRNGSRRQ